MVTNAEVAAYLRVSSLAIALFDFVQTIPGEYRLYYQQSSFFRLSPACILFILVRYISVAALVTSSVGFFGSGFSSSACRHFYLVAPVLKLLATLVSQVILSIRTYAVSRKARWVFWTLFILFVLALVPEILGNVVRRVVSQTDGDCTSGNLPGEKLAWLHYLAAMVFDAVAMGITTWYLYKSSPGLTMMSSLTRLMLQEGLVYFLALTAFNVLNVILFRSNNIMIQSAATTLGQAITMIFSQKFILNLSDSALERSSRDGASRHRYTRSGPRSLSRGPFGTTRSHRSFDTKTSQVELDIRVEKDVQITVDDLRPYDGPASPCAMDSTTPSPATLRPKVVCWEAHELPRSG